MMVVVRLQQRGPKFNSVIWHLESGDELCLQLSNYKAYFTPPARWSGSAIDALKLLQDPAYRACWSGDDLFAVKMLVAGGRSTRIQGDKKVKDETRDALLIAVAEWIDADVTTEDEIQAKVRRLLDKAKHEQDFPNDRGA